MSKVIYLNELTPQEEIFCQYYLQTVDNVYSAFKAGMAGNLTNKKYDDLTISDRRKLSRAGNKALKRPAIKERISFMAAENAKKDKKAQLDELLSFLTSIIRQVKNNEFKNFYDVKNALKAVEILIKHYPDFEGGAKREEKFIFARRRPNK